MRKKAEKGEKKLAKKIQGRKVRGSGSNKNAPGDVYKTNKKGVKFLIESKETANDSISIKGNWIRQLEQEAFQNGKIPILYLNIAGLELYAMFPNDFLPIMEEMKNE